MYILFIFVIDILIKKHNLPMKYNLLFSFFLTSCIAINAQSTCEDAFSAANYSVAHATNAYEAYNMIHVQEWAAKAMETFQEVEYITSECGCDDVSNLAYEGYEASEKSQYENTWERSCLLYTSPSPRDRG